MGLLLGVARGQSYDGARAIAGSEMKLSSYLKILPTTILVTFGTLQYFSAGSIHYKQNKTLYLVQKTWYRSCLTSCRTI